MSQFVADENIQIRWVPDIADVDAPTEAEIAAGTDLTPFIPKAGWNPAGGGDDADTSTLKSRQDTAVAGTFNFNGLSLEFLRDDTTDTAWDTFEHGTAGFIVVREAPGAADATIEAADDVQVYPVEAKQPRPMQTAKNESRKFTVEFSVTDIVNLKSVVAA